MRARENPFRTEAVLKLRYRLPPEDWHNIRQRLRALNYRASIVGPHGSGKTTLLEDLAAHLKSAGFRTRSLRLDETEPSFPRGFIRDLNASLTNEDCLLFDGAEQLSGWAWHRFKQNTAQAGGIIITTHCPGRLPVLIECRTSAELLRDLAAELLGAEPRAVEERARELYEKHGGNLRLALREWYECAASGDCL